MSTNTAPRTRRRATVTGSAVAGLAAFTLLLTGCGGDDKDPSGVAKGTGTVAPKQQSGGPVNPEELHKGLLAYSKCMRDKGVTNFPDPIPGKGLQVNGNEMAGNPNYKTAEKACESKMPPPPPNADKDARETGLKYAACMRKNGVTKFPDPQPGGGMDLDMEKIGMDPSNPVFKKAEAACKDIMKGAVVN